MSEAVMIALIASIGPTLLALSGLIVSILNGQKLTTANIKTDSIIGKATEIHTLTNSNLAKVTAALETANARIEGLQKLVASLVEAKSVADKVAERAIDAHVTAASAAAAAPVAPVVILSKIEENTAQTAAGIAALVPSHSE